MSRYTSPSPSNMLYEAPRPRRGRLPRSQASCAGHSRDRGSRSRSASTRPPPSEPEAASRSRSRFVRQTRRWQDQDSAEDEPLDGQSQSGEEASRHEPRARRRRESPRPVHSSGTPRQAILKEGYRGRDKLRERGRDRESTGRHGRERDRKRDQRRRRVRGGQQAPLQMAMMQGMMMHPMHMAMMGMVPPPYLAAMQRPPGPAQAAQPAFSGEGSRSKRRGAGDDGEEGKGSSSSSSDSSDSESSTKREVPNPAAAMAAMAAMWSPAAAVAGNGEVNVEAFLTSCPIDPEAAKRMRALPPALQQSIIRRGPLAETRNPSAVLIARVRDAESGRMMAMDPRTEEVERSASLVDDMGSKPARRSAKVTIEAMIRDYRLSPGCAWMLRALPPDKQKLAARIDPAGQADPSGYVAEQLKKIV